MIIKTPLKGNIYNHCAKDNSKKQHFSNKENPVGFIVRNKDPNCIFVTCICQLNEVQNKPFTSPLDYDKLSVTSFFMQERIVYGNPDVHAAWDFACPAQTPVYAVCDGKVEKVSFRYSTNTIDTSGGGGNQITISCDVDDIKYKVIYAHLYPNSSTVKEGDTVTQNQKIASVGTTGYSTGNHLHFQVSKDGTTIDGLSLVDFTNTDTTNPYIIPTNPNYGLDDGLYHP